MILGDPMDFTWGTTVTVAGARRVDHYPQWQAVINVPAMLLFLFLGGWRGDL